MCIEVRLLIDPYKGYNNSLKSALDVSSSAIGPDSHLAWHALTAVATGLLSSASAQFNEDNRV